MKYYDSQFTRNPNSMQGEKGKPFYAENRNDASNVKTNGNETGMPAERGSEPVIPLPSPGAGGPVYNGDAENTPAIPLPNPGAGGPVFGGETDNIPVIPLPNPGAGGPVYNGDAENTPIIPLPNPGEGGPVYPGPIITVPVRPVIPCFFCTGVSNGEVRFLNTAVGYNPFRISISGKTVVNNLEYAEVSEYGKVAAGYQTITVSGQNGYIFISKQVRITVGSKITIAIVNVAGGLDFTIINDVVCSTPNNVSCIRACNLSYNAGSLNFYLGRQLLVFPNVDFTEVTNYRRIFAGTYIFNISNDTEVLTATEITTRNNSQYTIYCFNWSKEPDAIRTLVIEDRK